jgi:Fur family ferric uptake transcriptional regulator
MPHRAGHEEREVLAAFLAKNRLKRSKQREAILDVFLRSERHVSVDDLYRLVRRKHPEVGRTTVYRTLKLLQQAGLASELQIEGESRFEREYKRQHHDHFICRSCGEIFEFQSPEIERLQEEVAAGIGFVIEGHRHQIYGRCRRCESRRA